MSPKTCQEKAAQSCRDEDGRIGVLLAACSLMVLVVVLVSAAVTSVQMQRRQLFACADAVAVGSAGLMRAEGYFDSADLLFDSTLVESKAHHLFEVLSDTTCQVGEGAQLTNVEVNVAQAPPSAGSASLPGGIRSRVEVEVEATAKLPLLPRQLRLTSQPLLLRVSSTADLK